MHSWAIAKLMPFSGRCCGLWKYHPLQAHWTAQSEFSEILVETDALKHHMPNNMLKALHRLQRQEKLAVRDQ